MFVLIVGGNFSHYSPNFLIILLIFKVYLFLIHERYIFVAKVNHDRYDSKGIIL